MGNGVNFAIFSRHAIGVRLDLFAAVQDAMPVRTVVLNPLRNKTGDIWHVWLEGVGSGQLYGFRVAGPYNPDEGQRFKCGQAGNRSLRNRRKLSALLL